MLLATIKNLGRAPCPRCLVQKKEIHRVGTPSDMRHRQKIRVDDEERRDKVEKARAFMFKDGLAITSKSVKQTLDNHSMVATRVSLLYCIVKRPTNTLPERIL